MLNFQLPKWPHPLVYWITSYVCNYMYTIPPASWAFNSSSAWLALRFIGLVFVGWPLLSPAEGAPALLSWRGSTGWNLEVVTALVDSSLTCCCEELGDDAALSLVSPTLELTDWLSLSPSSAARRKQFPN